MRTATTELTENYNMAFGGLVSEYDFCTYYPRSPKMPSFASRIASDWKFDEKCRKNTENRDKNAVYKKEETNV